MHCNCFLSNINVFSISRAARDTLDNVDTKELMGIGSKGPTEVETISLVPKTGGKGPTNVETISLMPKTGG